MSHFGNLAHECAGRDAVCIEWSEGMESESDSGVHSGVQDVRDRALSHNVLAGFWNCSRKRKRWILPVAVLGRSSTNRMSRGYL